jgi:uncharacterized protein
LHCGRSSGGARFQLQGGTVTIESPCVNVCVIDPRTRLCEGCGRSIDEIGSWRSYTPEERRRIMAVLPTRRAIKKQG